MCVRASSLFVECIGFCFPFDHNPLYLLCKVYTLKDCGPCVTGILNCALAVVPLYGWSQNVVSPPTKKYVCVCMWVWGTRKKGQ